MSLGRRQSFRSLLRNWIFGYLLVALLLSSALLLKYANDEVDRSLDMAENLVQLYADDSVSIEFGRGNTVYVQDALRRLVHLLKAERARILSSSGAVVESTESSEIGSRPSLAASSVRILSASVREHSSGEKLGRLEVQVDRGTLMANALRTALFSALAVLLGLILLAWVVVGSLRKKLIHPLTQLLKTQEPSEAESLQWPVEIQDLSRRLQDALRQRDSAMIGQVAGGIMHDIKTRIHTVASALELIDELPVDSPKRLSRLEGLHRASSVHLPKIKKIVESTLDGSRSIPIHSVPMDIRDTVRSVVFQQQEYADKRGVKIDMSAPTDELIFAHDALQLERAIGNVLKNGIEAFDDTDIIDRRLHVSVRRAADQVSIQIEDSGPGLTLAPDVLLSSLRSTKAHGAGLGLLISRKIVEGHGGVLNAGTSDGLKGARFEISLPLKEGT